MLWPSSNLGHVIPICNLLAEPKFLVTGAEPVRCLARLLQSHRLFSTVGIMQPPVTSEGMSGALSFQCSSHGSTAPACDGPPGFKTSLRLGSSWPWPWSSSWGLYRYAKVSTMAPSVCTSWEVPGLAFSDFRPPLAWQRDKKPFSPGLGMPSCPHHLKDPPPPHASSTAREDPRSLYCIATLLQSQQSSLCLPFYLVH
jgi:hypothetical protein